MAGRRSTAPGLLFIEVNGLTIENCIKAVDEIKPNAFSNETKTEWLNEVEGMVQTEIFLFQPVDLVRYSYESDKNTEMLVDPPHDKLYRSFLEARIDYANGEYEKYTNTMQMFNADYGEFLRWFALYYEPADAHREGLL